MAGSDTPHVYREYAPHPALARHVERYWSVTGSANTSGVRAHRVLPDGCREILLPLLATGEDPRLPSSRPFAVGVMTQAIQVKPTGPVHLWGVRFNPGGATPYIPAPADLLRDRTNPLDELWGRSDSAELIDQLEEAAGAGARCAILDRVLLERLDSSRIEVDPLVLQAAELARPAAGDCGLPPWRKWRGWAGGSSSGVFWWLWGCHPK